MSLVCLARIDHIRKEHGRKPWGMGYPGDTSTSSRKVITMKMRQNLGHSVRDRLSRFKFGTFPLDHLYTRRVPSRDSPLKSADS